MNLQELSAHLEQECYQPNTYHIGSGWEGCGDTYCIENIGGQFEVFYVERGQRRETIYHNESEAAACNAFLAALDGEPFTRAHCFGFFTTKSEADNLSERLTSAGITVHRDTIPYGSATDLRYRVFVFGREKLRAQEIVGHKVQPVA